MMNTYYFSIRFWWVTMTFVGHTGTILKILCSIECVNNNNKLFKLYIETVIFQMKKLEFV